MLLRGLDNQMYGGFVAYATNADHWSGSPSLLVKTSLVWDKTENDDSNASYLLV